MGENSVVMQSRRSFLYKTMFGLVLLSIADSCQRSAKKILLKISGTKYTLGHRLWTKDFPKPIEEEYVKYVIVGGGISGLSAARYLSKNGVSDFVLLELDDHIGGNSSNGENQYSKYPRGAHYLPLPNIEDSELIGFLSEEDIIKEIKDGVPVFDENQLSFPPQERLFYRGSWQEDLVPKCEVGSKAYQEFEHFFESMNIFKQKKDEKGAYWFDLPIRKASKVPEVLKLDNITMYSWLTEKGFSSEELFWYVDYCCKDDYGMGIDSISAWAGIHYFTARKQNYKSQYKNNVLTWPEGNAHLAKLLSQYSLTKTRKNSIVYSVQQEDNEVVKLNIYDASANTSTTIKCDKVIMATPQFVNQYLFSDRKNIASRFVYAPWIVAAITLNADLDGETFPLSWDNVIYGSQGLGYVYDQQQNLAQIINTKVISYYLPFSNKDVAESRKSLYRKPDSYWQKMILDDLSKVHSRIEETIVEIEIFKLGHGMISPVKGFMTSAEKKEAEKPIDDKIFFAHTDLSGISVFEEAFHQGIEAVKQMLKS